MKLLDRLFCHVLAHLPRYMIAVWVGGLLLSLSLAGGIAYVVVHFVRKFW
jgi:hypothetical protein